MVLTQTVTIRVRVPTTSVDDVQSEDRTFDRFWRVIVTGGTFRVMDTSLAIWLDDKVVNVGGVVEDGLMVILYDPSLLQDGARIGLSMDRGASSPMYLTETLQLDISP